MRRFGRREIRRRTGANVGIVPTISRRGGTGGKPVLEVSGSPSRHQLGAPATDSVLYNQSPPKNAIHPSRRSRNGPATSVRISTAGRSETGRSGHASGATDGQLSVASVAGEVFSSGEIVTIFGQNFEPGMKVDFDGIKATNDSRRAAAARVRLTSPRPNSAPPFPPPSAAHAKSPPTSKPTSSTAP